MKKNERKIQESETKWNIKGGTLKETKNEKEKRERQDGSKKK
jgi:hypothetical protein